MNGRRSKVRFSQRSRIEIMACILNCANPVSRKTRILYSCNLSYQQLKLYLKYLAENGFLRIREQKNKTIFEATEKGKEFLKDYHEIKGIIEKSHDI